MPINTAQVPLPEDFDPQKHTQILLQKFAQKAGTGWKIASIDKNKNIAYMEQATTTTEVHKKGNTLKVELSPTTKTTDGDKIATKMQQLYPEYQLTDFQPYLGHATLTRLDDKTIRAREALAVAIKVKPWDIKIKPVDNGYDIQLPPTYMASRHDKTLQEAVTNVIGEKGWWIKIDGETLRGKIREGEKPHFPPVIPLPPYVGGKQMFIPVGETLGMGAKKSEKLYLNMEDNAGTLLVGTPGSGKTVTINAIITGCLERGWEIGIGDVPHKAGDFSWCKHYCKQGFYGAESKRATETVVEKVYALRDERKKLLDQYGVVKWNDLPSDIRPAPFLLVLDELTGLFYKEKLPTGIPKDSEIYQEALLENLSTQRMIATVQKIALELRFVGVRLLLATQQAQANTGISVPLKMALPNRILMGAKTDKRAKTHAFLDPDNVPDVPEEIVNDAKMAKGAGTAEIEGEKMVVFKSFYASPDALTARLNAANIPTTSQPEPSEKDLAKWQIVMA